MGLESNSLLIGNIGRLIKEKDQETLIRAMPSIVEQFPHARLLIVGDGPLRRRLQELVGALAIGSYVCFTRAIGRMQVYKLLHAIDIFVMCSITEGFCNAVVEAMAARKPVIITDAGALPEVVGDAGIVVPPRQPESLAGAVLHLASLDVAEQRRIGAAGRRRTMSLFELADRPRNIPNYM